VVGTGRPADDVPARCWVLRDRMRFDLFGGWKHLVTLGLLLSVVLGRRGRYRPYFENYTVDASIFNMTFRGCVV
jgi:hypothetical protein